MVAKQICQRLRQGLATVAMTSATPLQMLQALSPVRQVSTRTSHGAMEDFMCDDLMDCLTDDLPDVGVTPGKISPKLGRIMVVICIDVNSIVFHENLRHSVKCLTTQIARYIYLNIHRQNLSVLILLFCFSVKAPHSIHSW